MCIDPIYQQIIEQRDALQRQFDALNLVIEWALGANGPFPERQEGQGAYWWRRELRQRQTAAIEAAKEG